MPGRPLRPRGRRSSGHEKWAYWSGNCRNWTKTKNPSFARLALQEKRGVNSVDVRVGPRQQHEENQANCDRDRISRTPKRLPFDVLRSRPIDGRNL